MKIAFHSEQLSYGGTEIALFDYAKYNQEILGNESVIIYPVNSPDNVSNIVTKFKNQFNVIEYKTMYSNHNHHNDMKYIDELLRLNQCDAIYSIKYGINDGLVSSECKTLSHAVFDISQPHGNKFASISKWLSSTSNDNIPYVPHMINLPDYDENIREYLGIPYDSIVFGRHGSFKSFDIDFVKDTINIISNENNNIYFIFLNTEVFDCNHNKCFFIEATDSVELKLSFINTCNAMIHARFRGETFGLSVGEFSVKNKPVITYKYSPEKSHIDILGNVGIYYSNMKELYKILTSYTDWYNKNTNYDCYSKEYNTISVMNKFNNIFLR